MCSFPNFPSHHPHHLSGNYWTGGFQMVWGHDYLQGADLFVAVGSRDFAEPVTDALSHVPIVRIGMDTDAMGRTNATDVSLVSDVKEALEDLEASVRSQWTNERIAKLAKSRSEEVTAISSSMRAEAEAKAARQLGATPMYPVELGAALAKHLDPNAIIVSENLTGRYDAVRCGHRDGERWWVKTTGNGLGWGVGAATGMKLAQPDRQVVCSIGDGSLMYSAAGFWTQARYGVPVLTIVWNNKNYQTVRFGFHNYNKNMSKSQKYVGLYLGDPNIDFAMLAKSQGLEGEKVETGAELGAALQRGIAATRSGTSYVLDVDVARYGNGAESTWHQKFNLANERKRKV